MKVKVRITFSLCGNCGTMCFPELTITAAERGRVVWVLPSSNWKWFWFKTDRFILENITGRNMWAQQEMEQLYSSTKKIINFNDNLTNLSHSPAKHLCWRLWGRRWGRAWCRAPSWTSAWSLFPRRWSCQRKEMKRTRIEASYWNGIPDNPSGDIYEASNKESSGWRLSRWIVAHLWKIFEK